MSIILAGLVIGLFFAATVGFTDLIFLMVDDNDD